MAFNKLSYLLIRNQNQNTW